MIAHHITYDSRALRRTLREIEELTEVVRWDPDGDIPEHIADALARDLERIRDLPEVNPCI